MKNQTVVYSHGQQSLYLSETATLFIILSSLICLTLIIFYTDHIFPYLLYRKAREYEKTGQTKKSLSELNRLKVTPASTNVVRALADVLSPIFDERTSSVWNDRVFGAIRSYGRKRQQSMLVEFFTPRYQFVRNHLVVVFAVGIEHKRQECLRRNLELVEHMLI